IASGGLRLPGLNEPLHEASLEELRATTEATDSATSGLAVIFELHRRVSGRADSGWVQSSAVRSAWQPSLATVFDAVTTHLESEPTVADTLWWLVQNFIINVHEKIAYSKLPEHTFRFRWEDGRVRFYDNGIGRFPLAAIRHRPLASITRNLGFWERGD